MLTQQAKDRIREDFKVKFDFDKDFTLDERAMADISDWLIARCEEEMRGVLNHVYDMVREETPKHITRDYRETDAMRDRIGHRIFGIINNQRE
jgi:hypothetical protein